MPAYRFEQHGFEIDLPADWSTTRGLARVPLFLSNVINRANILEEFSRGSGEWLNIVVESMVPEPTPEINELVFRLQALERNYTDLQFGRIPVAGRLHAWVRYVMLGKVWSKKYLVVLDGRGFAFTASCAAPKKLPDCEANWDSMVGSFRLLAPIREAITALNTAPSSRRMLERMQQSLIAQLEQRTRDRGSGPTTR